MEFITPLIGTLVNNSPIIALLIAIGWAGYKRMWVWGSYYDEMNRQWESRYQEQGTTWKERLDEKTIEVAEYKTLAFKGSKLLENALEVARQQSPPSSPPSLPAPGPRSESP